MGCSSLGGEDALRPRDRELAQQLGAALTLFDRNNRALPGITDPAARETFIEQMLESVRRVSYPSRIATRGISERRADPNDDLFDPIKAAILFQRLGNIDEAFWMVFLFVHFGKHASPGWHYARGVYGRLGGPGKWDWPSVSSDPAAFRTWFHANLEAFKTDGPHGFGNHRKYESLSDTGAVVESYVRWVAPPRSHQELMSEVLQRSHGDHRRAFDDIYRSLTVARFGRTARFDYLTMVGKLGLSPIEPGSTYMSGATGPLTGARLLFGSNDRPANLDRALVELDSELNVGMQVLEDALCNWQKSPSIFKPVRS